MELNKQYDKCLRCGRKLKNEEARIRGFGTVCWEKYKNEIEYKELFKLGSDCPNKGNS